jgi:hypothetical protein
MNVQIVWNLILMYKNWLNNIIIVKRIILGDKPHSRWKDE